MEKLNFIIAKNLSELRRKNKLTQLEVAEKLNYSDKAVSKWEQGESLPGIEVLYKLAKLYGVSMDYIVGEKEVKPARAAFGGLTQKRKRIITLLSVLGVWLFATVFYIFFNIFAHANLWTLFCWAVPAQFTRQSRWRNSASACRTRSCAASELPTFPPNGSTGTLWAALNSRAS